MTEQVQTPAAPAAPAQQIDVEAITQRAIAEAKKAVASEKIDVKKIRDEAAAEATTSVKKDLANFLTGTDPNRDKTKAVHDKFLEDPNALFQTAINMAVEESMSRVQNETTRRDMNRKIMNAAASRVPDLEKYPGEIRLDFLHQ